VKRTPATASASFTVNRNAQQREIGHLASGHLTRAYSFLPSFIKCGSDQCIDAWIDALNLADVRVNHFNGIDLSVPDSDGRALQLRTGSVH
jgi:hypothetical protein